MLVVNEQNANFGNVFIVIASREQIDLNQLNRIDFESNAYV